MLHFFTYKSLYFDWVRLRELKQTMWSIYEIIHIWTAVVDESEEWSSQLNFQLERRSLKKSGLQRDSNPWPPRYRWDALPTDLWSHPLGARSVYWVHISRKEWNDVKYIWNNCDDHSSLSSTTAVQIWIISYILHIISLHGKISTQ